MQVKGGSVQGQHGWVDRVASVVGQTRPVHRLLVSVISPYSRLKFDSHDLPMRCGWSEACTLFRSTLLLRNEGGLRCYHHANPTRVVARQAQPVDFNSSPVEFNGGLGWFRST